MSQTTLQKNISRLMALLLCWMLLLPCIPVAQAEGGSCGSGLTWSLNGNTLVISGTGAMADYSTDNLPPWYDYRNEIYQLSLPEGLTRVGNLAFYECINITSVTLPSTVTDIGELGFCENRSIRMVTLNNGLQTIGRSAFEGCENLQDVRIPDTVTTIGKRAFYECRSLAYVTVPASVTSMGSSVFSYCDNLVRVDVQASVSALPTWSFYGCDNLNTVTFGGETLDAGSLKTGSVSSGNTTQTTPRPSTSENSAGTLEIQQQENGGLQISGTTTTKTENSTITKTESFTQSEADETVTNNTNITASVVKPSGWNEVVEQIQSAQSTTQTQVGSSAKSNSDLTATVYVANDNIVPKEVLQKLAGSNVVLTVETQSGSMFKIRCAELDAKDIKADLDLSYTLSPVDSIPEEVDAMKAYQLVFRTSSEIKVEAMIHLPMEHVRHAASLYQLGKKGVYDLLQSVVVDADGYAHYYLASINKDVQYLIAMDVQGEQSAQAIVPENMYDEYRLVDHSTGKEYVITGRKSSWNMGLGKVMAILAVVMISAIVVIGFIMYFWNKQRLKAGYVPQWEDEEDDQSIK